MKNKFGLNFGTFNYFTEFYNRNQRLKQSNILKQSKNILNGICRAVVLLLIGICSVPVHSFSQVIASNDTATGRPLLKMFNVEDIHLPQILKTMKVGGYYRFLGWYTDQSAKLAPDNGPSSSVAVGDNYREPLLLISLTGSPTDKVSFGTDFYIGSNYYRGLGGGRSINGDSISLNLGGSVSGGIKTRYGNYSIQAGGIIWYSLSPFTMGVYQSAYNRFSVFERNPWEPVSKGASKYRTFFNEGRVMQGNRWGQQAFQGVILEGNNMPGKLSFSLIYGKTVNNGGAGSYLNRYTPNFSYGGRVKKDFDFGYISLNNFSNVIFLDSLSIKTAQYQVFSSEFSVKIDRMALTGEIGLGSYSSPTYQKGWSPGLNLTLKLPSQYTFIPLDITYFYFGKNMVNINSTFLNTTIVEANKNYAGNAAGSLFPSASPILDIGQFSNNRQGVNLNTSLEIGENLRIGIGNSIAGELERSGKSISVGHRVNGLALSRIYNFSFMPATFGPYNNLSSIFRGYYEQVKIADTTMDGRAMNLKYFNTFEFHAKYRTQVFSRSLYINYVGSFNSVQNKLSVIPVFDPSAYVRVYYNEFDLFYNIVPSFTLCGYFGIERIIGNNTTDLGDVQASNGGYSPRNQTGTGIGAGFDWDLGSNIGLYFRNRWYQHADPNFKLDVYKGYEALLELKILFN